MNTKMTYFSKPMHQSKTKTHVYEDPMQTTPKCKVSCAPINTKPGHVEIVYCLTNFHLSQMYILFIIIYVKLYITTYFVANEPPDVFCYACY